MPHTLTAPARCLHPGRCPMAPYTSAAREGPRAPRWALPRALLLIRPLVTVIILLTIRPLVPTILTLTIRPLVRDKTVLQAGDALSPPLSLPSLLFPSLSLPFSSFPPSAPFLSSPFPRSSLLPARQGGYTQPLTSDRISARGNRNAAKRGSCVFTAAGWSRG